MNLWWLFFSLLTIYLFQVRVPSPAAHMRACMRACARACLRDLASDWIAVNQEGQQIWPQYASPGTKHQQNDATDAYLVWAMFLSEFLVYAVTQN